MNIPRYKFLDYAKGLGILLVMFAHCTQYFESMNGINEYICNFHVPLFFIISGCLSYQKNCDNFKSFLIKRMRRLLVPWAVFSFINSFLKLGILFLRHSLTNELFMAEMVQLFITGNGTVWFLTTLFSVEVIFWPVRKGGWIEKKIVMAMIMLIGLLCPYGMQKICVNPFGTVLVRTISACGYYAFGIILAGGMLSRLRSSWQLIGVSMVSIATGIIIYSSYGVKIRMMSGTFEYPISSILYSLLNCSALILFFKYMEDFGACSNASKVMEYYGQNSLSVMVIHPNLLLCFTYPFGRFMADCVGIIGGAVSMLLWIVIVLLEIPFVWLIHNRFPWMIGQKRVRA